MSPELRQYLTEWYEWATGDAENGKPFWRCFGLCTNAPQSVRDELKAVFAAEFGNSRYPFGHQSYSARSRHESMHLCPKRLAWVRKKLGLPDAEAAAEQAEYRADQARDRAMIEQWEQGDVL